MLIVVRKKEGEAYSLRLSGKLGIVFLHRGPFSNTVPRRCRVMDMPETKALGQPWKVPAGLSE